MSVTAPPDVLSRDQIEQFWELGYVVVKSAVSREEAERYRNVILDMLPRDLHIPAGWSVSGGRIKPYHDVPERSHTYDTPELLPLLCNETLYGAAAQLLGSERLRVGDGSLGITMRNDAGPILSQNIHLDASVPADLPNFLFTQEELQVGGCYYFTDVLPEGGGIHIVPGGHRIVEEKARASAEGRKLYRGWKRLDDFPETVEVTGEAGDFALLHHLMPHAASSNRRPVARVAQFTRWTRVDHAHYPAKPAAPDRYNQAQLAAMTPLGRKLLGVDSW
ncbi:MAG TPA: phytanoyl-CoA dioxygenase family protein [Candidatus Dormibacteraeota bacterium]|jgi:ectoine hydroxylase-related dioxygenase (phytanoyl-CoA dioxygenase family)|nr:phytanoyl-CoA dioxygenase family protein [Candidatus Dormibacteraeota bacterium]